jgi:hypothetical protein
VSRHRLPAITSARSPGLPGLPWLLWAGAVPGSMGPIAPQRIVLPVAASASSNLKPSTLR